MAINKVLAFTIAALFICSVFIETTNADKKHIGYKGLNKNGFPCKNGECHRETPANKYRRGCTVVKKCKDDGEKDELQ
ncbi:hypothetical protein FRX31_024162 [Thalictrum thalictroides]|uniref:Uncharacterized protein n=1 Tax=Thalictrum thalictroides TaxID=46969 RepID=A0A7J6VNB6_THATH|nr:hypothetical protein FRX31_024162 [Thalictrum thalictroides]